MTAWKLSKEEYVEICARKAAYEAHLRYQNGETSGPENQRDKPKLLNRTQAAELLGRSESYLRKLEGRGFIKRVAHQGRNVRYTIEEVERCKKRLDMK